MTFNDYLLLFGGMSLVTYLPRTLPLLYLAHRQIPQWLIDWLSLIPVAILSALLAPTLFTDTATRSIAFGKLEFLDGNIFAEFFRQITDINHAKRKQNSQTFDQVCQFTHVTRPAVLAQ